jgi:hypothetical protein
MEPAVQIEQLEDSLMPASSHYGVNVGPPLTPCMGSVRISRSLQYG